MLTQQGGKARSIDTGDIRDVIAVLFQPIYCGVFGAKKKVLWAGIGAATIASGDRPVIADLIGTAGSGIAARAVAAVEVVRRRFELDPSALT